MGPYKSNTAIQSPDGGKERYRSVKGQMRLKKESLARIKRQLGFALMSSSVRGSREASGDVELGHVLRSMVLPAACAWSGMDRLTSGTELLLFFLLAHGLSSSASIP